MTGWLASITNIEEATMALASGVDIIDAKNPHAGALGALPHAMVRSIVQAVNGRVPVSATVGDFHEMDPHIVTRAVQQMATTGVTYVKLGLYHAAALYDCLQALEPLCRNTRLIAVLFADNQPDFQLLENLKRLGFTGVMLDTMHKSSGRLTEHLDIMQLAAFVHQAQALNLICGLAGSLRVSDIPSLSRLKPDYLGFRGALCTGNKRTHSVDAHAMQSIS